MTLSSCQVVPHLSPRWDTGGLCSASPINHTLIKAFCLVKWAAWETLWKGSYHLEAAREKERGALTPWIPQSLNVQSWNHSENWTHLDESHLKIDSLECNLTDKKPLFGKMRWATHTLAYMNRRTMETIPVSQWEYVSAYYSLSFQISTLLGFIVRETLPGVRPAKQTEGIFIPRQQSAETPAETGVLETGEKCAQRFCALVALLSLCAIFFVF